MKDKLLFGENNLKSFFRTRVEGHGRSGCGGRETRIYVKPKRDVELFICLV